MRAHKFRDYVLIPTLKQADVYLAQRHAAKKYKPLLTDAAVELLLRTAAHESHLRYIEQVGPANARGLFQMEVPTLNDLLAAFQPHRPELFQLMHLFLPPVMKPADALYGVLPFQVITCRLQYWRRPESLPAAGDADGMWYYYKRFWNSHLGDAERHEFDRDWRRFGPKDMQSAA